jgi:hypothetical protein
LSGNLHLLSIIEFIFGCFQCHCASFDHHIVGTFVSGTAFMIARDFIASSILSLQLLGCWCGAVNSDSAKHAMIFAFADFGPIL